MPTPTPGTGRLLSSGLRVGTDASADGERSCKSQLDLQALDASLQRFDSLRQDIIDAIRHELRQETSRNFEELKSLFEEAREQRYSEHAAQRYSEHTAHYSGSALWPEVGSPDSPKVSLQAGVRESVAREMSSYTKSSPALGLAGTVSKKKVLKSQNSTQAFNEMAHGISGHILSLETKAQSCWRRAGQKPETRFANFVLSPQFTTIISVVIVLNIALMGYETDIDIRDALEEPQKPLENELLRKLNLFFTIVYAFELLVRVAALKFWFFVGSEWRWDLFDMFLVVTSVIQEVLESFTINFIRVIRVFRIIRVARIVRVLRFFHALRQMVVAIASSLAALSWAFTLLLLIIYLFSIFFLQGAISYIENARLEGTLQTTPVEENLDGVKEYYHTLFATCLSLIEAISGGNDWRPMANILAEHSEVYRIAFVCYVVFVIFGVLNVLTGVFVSAASDVMDRDIVVQKEIDRKLTFVRQMKQIFDELDVEQSGNITWSTFHKNLQNEELQAYFKAHDLDPSDARMLFTLLDHNNSEEVDIMEFAVGCVRLQGVAKSMHVRKLMADVAHFEHLFIQHIEKLNRQLHNVHAASHQLGSRGVPAHSTPTREINGNDVLIADTTVVGEDKSVERSNYSPS